MKDVGNGEWRGKGSMGKKRKKGGEVGEVR
jgi:hypothetical protein